MPAPQSQGSSGTSDNSLDFLWLIVLIVGAAAILWYFARDQIAAVIFQIRWYEILLIDYVLSGYAKIADFLHLPFPNTDGLYNTLGIINSKPHNVSLTTLEQVSTSVGKFLRYPVVLIIGIYAVVTYLSNITARFKHVYTMDSLRKSEQKIWPQVSPVMKVDLVKKDLDEGPWAMSLSPMLFAKKHHLLIENKEDGKINVTLNEGAAFRVLALQVGQFWRDIDTMPQHIQALYAIFLARANHDREVADKLLKQISASSRAGKLDYSGVKEAVDKHKNSKLAKYTTQRHAYTLTTMATLLELARTDGVLATAEFIWLKPIDRPLWYMLNSVGRQTAFPEISGVFAHWLAEKKADRPLKVPMVDEAVKALELAIKEMIYEPDETSA